MNEQIIPSTYSGGGVSEEYTSPHTINDIDNNYLLSFKILPFSMYYYARDHIPNYNTITTYPNDPEYNPNTTGVTNFSYAFHNMVNCTDTLESIYNRFDWNNCTDMSGAFGGYLNLNIAGVTDLDIFLNFTGSIPNIPDSVVNMSNAFLACDKLIGPIPKLPTNVIDISYSFYCCCNLTGSIPIIPSSVTNMSGAFGEIYDLQGSIPTIPNNVTDISLAFFLDFGLQGSIPNIPDSVTDISGAFECCENLTGSIPKFPNNVLYISWAFSECYNISGHIPEIPNSVILMDGAFDNCTNLTGHIPEIPNNAIDISYSFCNCYNLTGSIPNIPNSVTNMSDAFYNCTGLSSSNVYIFSDNIINASYSFGFMHSTNVINIYVHANTTTYNTFYKAMGNSTYNWHWNCYLKTF